MVFCFFGVGIKILVGEIARVAEVRGSAAEGGRGGGGFRGGRGVETEAGVGLLARASRFVEDRAVDFGNNDVVAAERVDS